MASEEYNPDILTIVDDEDGTEHTFEVLDELEEDGRRYLALLPVYEEDGDMIDDPGELVILKVEEDGEEEVLITIEDDDEYDKIYALFEESLQDLFEFEEE